jgi:hypothetical protein
MDENMKNDFGVSGEDTASSYGQERTTPPENNAAYTERPVTPPSGYTPNYNPQYTYNNQANQYMPYGSYNYSNQNTQPQKKSKVRKKAELLLLLLSYSLLSLLLRLLSIHFQENRSHRQVSQAVMIHR